MDNDLKPLELGCEDLNIVLSKEQKEQFVRYYEILIKWNEVMNLTAITEFSEVLIKHFVDSLAIAKVMHVDKIESVIDIGTGAGFPGIPLKIAFPHLKITLLDSLKKRIGFLDCVIQELGLDGMETIHGRAEEYARQKQYRENYDVCVSRAVANLATLSEYCIPYVREGGCFVPYKSGKIQDELRESEKAIAVLGGKVREVHKFQLADTDMERSLVVIEKIKKTSLKYPRKAGTPSKEPLK